MQFVELIFALKKLIKKIVKKTEKRYLYFLYVLSHEKIRHSRGTFCVFSYLITWNDIRKKKVKGKTFSLLDIFLKGFHSLLLLHTHFSS